VKRAVIIGHRGQDGSYLEEQLVARGLAVVGLDRDGVEGLAHGPVDLGSPESTHAFLAAARPDALFYLAAVHHSSEQAQGELAPLLRQSFALHVDGWVNVLEGLERHAPGCHSFYAASSHVFGVPPTPTQNEGTPFAPDNIYGITKAAGVQVARLYRARGRHVSTGLLYNHESPRRGPQFVTQRVVLGALAAAKAKAAGTPFSLELGSTSAVVDWGYAADYTRAMWHIVTHPTPQDYVVASGVPHTVGELCDAAFSAVGLQWREWVTERPGRVVKQLAPLVGDPTRLKTDTGWSPTVDFQALVRLMVDAARSPQEHP
jgi:GDPmannose 4,6-dehydratase